MSAEVLTPKLTKLDQRVLDALADWPEGENPHAKTAWDAVEWRSAWQVAEAVGEEDVRTIRQILDGLDRLGYAVRTGDGWRAMTLRWAKKWR